MKKVATIATIFFVSAKALAAPLPQPPNKEMPRTITLEARGNNFDNWSTPLPCPTGYFSTAITVLHPVENAEFPSGAVIHLWGSPSDPGITFSFQTSPRLPLVLKVDKVGKTFKDIISRQRFQRTFSPGDVVAVEVAWVNRRSFSFLINGDESHTVTLDNPVTDLHLVGVGSRSVFDKNAVHCNLVS